MRSADQNKNWYVSRFESFEKSLNGEASSKIHTVRKAAIARFAELGFPTTRDEEWKYTDISSFTGVQFDPVVKDKQDHPAIDDVQRFLFKNEGYSRLTFINGQYAKHLSSIPSLPHGVIVGSLAEAMKNENGVVHEHLARHARYEKNAFAALSTAFLKDGAYIVIPKGVILGTPVHVLHVSTGAGKELASHPRNLIVAGSDSQATVIESYVSLSNDRYFTNAVTEIVLGENSVIEHEKLQMESPRALHVGLTHVQQARNSHLISNSVSFGGELVRNNITAILDGEGAECTLNGLYHGSDNQLVDNHTAIDHVKPNCSSHELYKGIMEGTSKGVFNGKIIVREEAQKTDAKQTNKNLILSEGATVDTKPQLEIFANDVKCTHGATIGQLDDESIFYLRSRGVGLDEARTMLIYAFAGEVVERVGAAAVRDRVDRILHERLAR